MNFKQLAKSLIPPDALIDLLSGFKMGFHNSISSNWAPVPTNPVDVLI